MVTVKGFCHHGPFCRMWAGRSKVEELHGITVFFLQVHPSRDENTDGS